MRNSCPTRCIYTSTIFSCICFFVFHFLNFIFNVSIKNIGAFKQEKEAKTKAVYLLNKLLMESIVTAQSQNLVIFETWNSIN